MSIRKPLHLVKPPASERKRTPAISGAIGRPDGKKVVPFRSNLTRRASVEIKTGRLCKASGNWIREGWRFCSSIASPRFPSCWIFLVPSGSACAGVSLGREPEGNHHFFWSVSDGRERRITSKRIFQTRSGCRLSNKAAFASGLRSSPTPRTRNFCTRV